MSDSLLSLVDIADLAGVRRPTVSNWRSRYRSSGHPFPAPVEKSAEQERFSAAEIAGWLSATGRGNNAEALGDAASFGSSADHDPDAFSALIALRALVGDALASTDPTREARRIDPEDSFLRSEVESFGGDLESAALDADRAIEAAWTAGIAFDRAPSPRPARTKLHADATALLADVALVLAGGSASGVFTDPTGVCADLLLAIQHQSGESGNIDVVLGRRSGERAARHARRRLSAHEIDWRERDNTQERRGSSTDVLVAQFPHELAAATAAAEVLTGVDDLLLDMPGTQRGVVIGPAAALCDRLRGDAANLRREILRDGRVRAVVRLPERLLLAHPRQALALWIVGPADATTVEGEQWTLLADVGEGALSPDVRSGIVDDVFATMRDPAAVRAHAFSFGQVDRTTAVIAQAGSLLDRRRTAGRPKKEAFAAAAERAVAIDALLSVVGVGELGALVAEPLEAAGAARPTETLGRLRKDAALRYHAGTRIDAFEIGATGHAVIGVPELLDASRLGSRHVGVLEFERAHTTSRRTLPGDVVFCTSPLSALVDRQGGSVVESPARILSPKEGSGLVPDVLAADIVARPAGSRRWWDWPVRRVAPDRVPPLVSALSAIIEVRAETQKRLRALEKLETLIIDGAVVGSIRHPLLPTRTETVVEDLDDTAPKGR